MNNLSVTFSALRARRGTVAFVLFVSAAVGVGIAFLLPNQYTARAAFYSEGKGSTDLSALGGLGGGLGGLGALMALAGGSSAGSQTGFFVDLLRSQAFFDSLAASVLPIGPQRQPMTVRSYVVKKAKTEAQHRWKARATLKKMIEVAREPSGIVVVSVEAKSPIA
ncbi:MAG: Wzz/FepE/Etk N-terminal domain-containing protein, partial [Gemmatimonadota bacterium]|nr:Wzz/FepE/Etk N-terminal domain-containing protein [Gemmatimonadota bacterium]